MPSSGVAPAGGALLLESQDAFGQIVGSEGQGKLGLQVIQRRFQWHVPGRCQRPLAHTEQQRRLAGDVGGPLAQCIVELTVGYYLVDQPGGGSLRGRDQPAGHH